MLYLTQKNVKKSKILYSLNYKFTYITQVASSITIQNREKEKKRKEKRRGEKGERSNKT